jgi:hypothetical protein
MVRVCVCVCVCARGCVCVCVCVYMCTWEKRRKEKIRGETSRKTEGLIDSW